MLQVNEASLVRKDEPHASRASLLRFVQLNSLSLSLSLSIALSLSLSLSMSLSLQLND